MADRGKGDPSFVFQLLVGLALVLAGVVLPLTRAEDAKGWPWQIVCGAALAALGGAFISWLASVWATRAEAEAAVRAEFSMRLNPTSRNIAQTSAQVIQTVNRGIQEDISADTALEIIYQSDPDDPGGSCRAERCSGLDVRDRDDREHDPPSRRVV